MFPYSTYACSTNCHFSPPPPPLPPPSISFPPGCRSLFLRAKFTFRYRARAGWARLANPPMSPDLGPFFLLLAHTAPHDPLLPAPRHIKQAAMPGELKSPPTWNLEVGGTSTLQKASVDTCVCFVNHTLLTVHENFLYLLLLWPDYG